ncbi:flavodoxin domain-containing protein [Actinomadura viridis]|uniref:Menaquinone-dependent protoporphyrinogen oxidase n=1 Tax=Actinomadura viridis TaxID=58110 RepID=A0A931GJF2_9ACTN|nr:flavodoxin domain-containing protein [Actinomadura viridis]MBG6089180.1 menaquinone-dependent protoporphyrinogen oxidase [Actinomadura viridis]
MFVLVGYATAHGSTRSIAERIGARLTERGNRVDVRPMDEVKDAGAYEAFVLGSAVHNQRWLPEASEFLHENQALFRERPVWAFSVGMPAALRGPWKRMGPREGPKITATLEKTARLRDHRLMSGVVGREQMSRAGHLVFRALGCRYGDYRDWAAVDGWADDIAGRLAAEGAPRPPSGAVREDRGGTR